jgi:hypothetical protein
VLILALHTVGNIVNGDESRGGYRFGRRLSRLTDFYRIAVSEFISVKRLIGGRVSWLNG